MQFLNKVYRFMYGRYGIDQLTHFLLFVYICCFLINLFIKNTILFILELMLILIAFYRTFSKKISIRKKENQLFLKTKESVLKPFQVFIKNRKDQNHVYKKCRKCKKILRFPLPMKRGIKHASCPNCHKKFTIFTLKYQKIEIIKNKKFHES